MQILAITINDKEYQKCDKFNNKWVSLNVTEMRQPDDYGNTHTVYQYNKETKEKKYCGKGKFLKFKNNTDNTWEKLEKEQQKNSVAEDVPF